MQDTFKKFDLTGKTAFVTGGGTGLGYCIARGLARAGASVMIAARREDVLKASAERMTEETNGKQVLYSAVDLTDRKSIANTVEYATKALNGVDIFVGNAGQDMFEPFENVKDETIDHIFQVNVAANISLTRDFLPHMRQKKWGRLIYSSSITSHRSPADEGMTLYAATKGALNTFARAIANEFGRDGITANSLVLGVWKTEMLLDNLDRLGPEVAKVVTDAFENMTSLGRLGEGEELEGLVQLLASDAGSYITGTESVIDGGMDVMLKPVRT